MVIAQIEMESFLQKNAFFVDIKKRLKEALFMPYKKSILCKNLECKAGLVSNKKTIFYLSSIAFNLFSNCCWFCCSVFSCASNCAIFSLSEVIISCCSWMALVKYGIKPT